MKNNNNDDKYRGPYFILDRKLLQPGDIILERDYEWHSEKIAKYTNSRYSLCNDIHWWNHNGGNTKRRRI